MSTLELLPLIATGTFGIFAVSILIKGGAGSKNSWLIAAAFCALFFAFSLETVLAEGLLGFWAEHTRSLWGNQVWFDLLLALGVAWAFIVPQAKAQGMRLVPWLILIGCTGSIGVLAMVARLLFLRSRAA